LRHLCRTSRSSQTSGDQASLSQRG